MAFTSWAKMSLLLPVSHRMRVLPYSKSAKKLQSFYMPDVPPQSSKMQPDGLQQATLISRLKTHPLRALFYEEAHARPSPFISTPIIVSHVVDLPRLPVQARWVRRKSLFRDFGGEYSSIRVNQARNSGSVAAGSAAGVGRVSDFFPGMDSIHPYCVGESQWF